MGWIVLTAALALTVLVLGLYLLSLRRSLGEVAEELESSFEQRLSLGTAEEIKTALEEERAAHAALAAATKTSLAAPQ